MMINRAQNYCTSSGSEFFKKKHKLSNDAFNLSHQSIYLSSIGFGMYKGEYKGKNQREIYQKIIKKFISSGVNVFDVARKYRNGFSEIDLGIAIRDLIKKKKVNRNELFISSKAGLINFYQDKKKNISIKDFARHRGLKILDLKKNIFCCKKKFLQQEIDISLKNLQLKTLDNYYIHNPEFLNGNLNNFKDYYQIFETFEKAIQNNKIRSYGISSWAGFRRDKQNPFFIDIKKIVKIANDVAGKKNGFKNLQVPLSVYMPFAEKNYSFSGNKNLLDYCYENKINIFTSASLYEGKIEQFLNFLKIFNYLNNKKKESIYDNLDTNSFTLPKSENSILQLFENLNLISKNIKKFNFNFDDHVYSKSLNLIRSKKKITSSLFGVDNVKQLNENVSILRKKKIDYLDQKKIWNFLLKKI